MYLGIIPVVLSVVAASTLEFPACDEIRDMRRDGSKESDPEYYASIAEDCLEEIDKIFEIEDWESQFSDSIEDALRYFHDFSDGRHDSDCDSEEEWRQRRSLRESWKQCLFDIANGDDNLNSLIERIRDEISCANYSTIVSSLWEDARVLSEEIEVAKSNLSRLRDSLRREIGLPVEDTVTASSTLEPIARRLRSSDMKNLPISKRLRSSTFVRK